MGRHADRVTGRRTLSALRPKRVSIPVVVICLLLAGAVVLGVWWWNLRSATDPIDADPVDAYAVVVDSPACADGHRTTVQLGGEASSVTATLSGCGFAKDQRLAVQYLAGHPQQVRLAGTTVAGDAGLASKLLPIGILAAGLVAVLATVSLLVERRRSRHLAAGRGISVAELRARARPAGGGDGGDGPAAEHDLREGTPPAGAAAAPEDRSLDGARSGDPVTDAGPGTGPVTDTDTADGADAGPGTGPVTDTDTADGADAVGEAATADTADGAGTGEPAHVLPSGFVIVEEQLFTHSGTEAGPAEDPPR